MRAAALIPAYNVEGTIAQVVRRSLPFVDKVVVVDDGSGDGTARVAERCGAEVLCLQRNTGKANATKVGIKKCLGYDAVVTLDGDLQHCPEEIPRLLEGVERGADICIGSRFLDERASMPRANLLSNKIASLLISALTGRRFTDPQSGFRALSQRALEGLELRAERYSIEHIMILEAVRKGFRIEEVPVSCIYGDERSHIRPLQDSLRVAYDILRFLL